jgi:hypothetical protein
MAGAAITDALTRRATGPRAIVDVSGPAFTAIDLRVAKMVTRPEVAQLIIDVAQPVATQVARQIWEPINHEVAQHISHPIAIPGYGQHDATRLAFYDALRERGVDVSELRPFMEIAQSCGWWWPFDDVCVLCERPSLLARDELGHLHSANGPAVLYPDGWSVHAWHGVRVPATTILHPELITLAQIEREANDDLRQVLMARYAVAERSSAAPGVWRTLRPDVVH